MEVPERVLALWRYVAGVGSCLTPGSRSLVRGSDGLCPPGWSGALRLGDAFVVEVGSLNERTASTVLSLPDPTDPDAVREVCRPAETLGPGELAYLPRGWTPPDPDPEIEVVPLDDVRAWMDRQPTDDVHESSVDEMDHVCVLRGSTGVVAVGGHLLWPQEVAHLGVLVAPDHRGTGAGRRVAAAATTRAHGEGLEPQWRAASDNAASRAVARAIGYVEIGRQFSFRID